MILPHGHDHDSTETRNPEQDRSHRIDACWVFVSEYELDCMSKALVFCGPADLERRAQIHRRRTGCKPATELKRAQYSFILVMRIPEVSMASTSVTLGPHWDEFIALMLKEGRYGSTSELIRASLRLIEEHEGQRARLRVALMEGKQSGDAGPLDMDEIKREARSRSDASDA